MPRFEAQFPDGMQSFEIPGEKASVAEILRRHGRPLNTRCGGRGVCDGCLLHLGGRAIRGCQHDAKAGEHYHISQRSLLRFVPQVVTNFKLRVSAGQQALCSGALVGAAIDIGTTTVALMLVDLNTGKVISTASGFNQQIQFGDNVLTRIHLCSQSEMLQSLRDAVIDQTILPLLREACESAELALRDIGCCAIAGNTTMLHLFAGVDPTPMGVVPFKPAFLEHRVIASKLPGRVHLLPGCSAYVGADLAAGAVATGLIYDEGPTLLVDIGTNGEIIFKHGGQLLGCATAAGPAFEGAGLTYGMRGGDGAISHIRIGDRVDYDVIGGGKPIGFCGSAYVDFLAEARQARLINEMGRFDGVDFKIGGVEIAESDIAKLMPAKAAIAAGILMLLDHAKVAPRDVNKLYLAGGFGMHINVSSAIRCGLLPGFTPEQVEVVGNTSLGGAYLALLDQSLLREMDRVRQQMRIVELNLETDFENCFLDQLMLP